MNRPLAIDLFAGAGGMSLGIEAAGFDVVSAVELDPVHCAVHKYNFPECNTVCADISELLPESVLPPDYSDIDLIVGGPPCQGFSQIGQRQLDDPRNKLVFDFVRFVKELRPKYFIFENVPGIIAGKHKVFVEELKEAFESIDYNVLEPEVLNAADFGAPQNRKRFIILGYRKRQRAPFFPKKTHHENPPNLFESQNSYIGADEAIGDLVKIPVFMDNDLGIDSSELDYSGYRAQYSFESKKHYEFCNRRHFINRLVFGHVGSKHTDKSIQRFSETPSGSTEPISRFFKLHPEKPCNTLRAGTASDRGAYTAPRPIHYELPRCISVREAARLHTYPDWFQFHQTIWHGFREIGNSVIPLFGKHLGISVREALGIDLPSIDIWDVSPPDTELLKMTMNQAHDYFGVSNHIAPRRRMSA